MSCRPSKVMRYRHTPDAGSVGDGDPKYGVFTPDSGENVTCVELGPHSELDAAVLVADSGTYIVARGAPAWGPFAGAIEVKPFYPMAHTGSANAFLVTDAQWTGAYRRLNDDPPTLELVFHYRAPGAASVRRAATRRTAAGTATSTESVAFELPVFGRKRATLAVVNVSGPDNYTFGVYGNIYVPTPGAGVLDNKTGGVVTAAVSQILEVSGVSSFTIASGESKSLTFYDESFHTLSVKGLAALASGSALRIYGRAEDE